MSTGHWHETYPSGQYCSEVDLRFAQDGQDYIDSLLRLRPSDILYSQDSIKRQFTDGKTLEFSFEQLLNDELTEEDIEPIEVVEDKDGLCWALNGHRRLFLYKMLERFHVVDTIPVKVLDLRDNATRRLFQDRKTTDTNGTSIKVRKRPQMERALEKLGKEFTERRRRERTNNNVVSHTLVKMSPSDILYSQDSIKCRFTDGTTLEGTFRRLLNEELRAKDIEPIDVVKDDGGRWWVLNGNRRLFLYKILEQFYLIHEIPVRVIDNVTQGSVRERFTTNTEGMSIRVRGRPQMAATLEKLCREYKDDRVDELILTNVEHSPVEYLDYPFSEYDEQYNCN